MRSKIIFIDENDKYKTIYLNEDMENIKANYNGVSLQDMQGKFNYILL